MSIDERTLLAALEAEASLAKAEIERLRAENAELAAALQPLVKISLWRDQYPDGPEILTDERLHSITVEDVRKARAALAKAEEQK